MGINTNRINRLRYTLYAPLYDIAVRVMDKHRRRSIGLLEIKDGEKVLIVGAGTGLDLDHITAGAEVTAIDITPAMVKRIGRRAERLGVGVNAMVMDGQALEFEDGSFDHVVLHLIVAVIPDPYKCMLEVQRVLRPGGTAVVFDKFLGDTQSPSFLRRSINHITSTLFSDINRRLGDIIKGTSLEKIHDEPAAFGGAFRIVILRKPSVGQ